jgi:cytochrome c553
MTAVPRTPLTTYVGRENYATDYAAGVLHYVALCARCHHLAEYTAAPDHALTVWCPTCEAGAA